MAANIPSRRRLTQISEVPSISLLSLQSGLKSLSPTSPGPVPFPGTTCLHSAGQNTQRKAAGSRWGCVGGMRVREAYCPLLRPLHVSSKALNLPSLGSLVRPIPSPHYAAANKEDAPWLDLPLLMGASCTWPDKPHNIPGISSSLSGNAGANVYLEAPSGNMCRRLVLSRPAGGTNSCRNIPNSLAHKQNFNTNVRGLYRLTR